MTGVELTTPVKIKNITKSIEECIMIKINKNNNVFHINIDNKNHIPQIIKVLSERGQVYTTTPNVDNFVCEFYPFGTDLLTKTIYEDLSSIPFSYKQYEIGDYVSLECDLGTKFIMFMNYIEYKQVFSALLNEHIEYSINYEDDKLVLFLWGLDNINAHKVLSHVLNNAIHGE